MIFDTGVIEGLGDGCFGRALSKNELRVLKLRDLLAKGGTLFDVGQCVFQRAINASHGVGRDQNPFLWKLLHHLDKALPFFGAQKGRGGNAHVVEEKLGCVVGFEPQFVEVTPAPKALKTVGFTKE